MATLVDWVCLDCGEQWHGRLWEWPCPTCHSINTTLDDHEVPDDSPF